LVEREIRERNMSGESVGDLPDLAIGGGEREGAVTNGNENFRAFGEDGGDGGDGEESE